MELGLGDNSLHIGVISTDDYLGNPVECNNLGALVTKVNTGYYPDSIPVMCGPYDEGFNFMTNVDDLEESFTCAARLGSNGSGSEKPIEALIEALKPGQSETVSPFESRHDNCNENFHRRAWTTGDNNYNGAGLAVIIITDEDDTDSAGNPEEWIEMLKWLRRPLDSQISGTLNNTTFLALLPNNQCATAGFIPVKLEEFLMMVPTSYVGSICDKDYTAFFDKAVGVVSKGCGFEYEPEP